MCTACLLNALTNKLLGIETVEENVGTISAPLLADFAKFDKDKKLASLDIEEAGLKARRQYLADEITEDDVDALQKDLQAKADQLTKDFRTWQDALWSRVYEELGLNPDDDHTLNHKTGEVTRETEVKVDEMTHRRRKSPQGGRVH